MKKLYLFLLIICFAICVWNKDTITTFIAQKFVFRDDIVVEESNDYYRNANYLFVQQTDDFHPNSKEDFTNIFYTILNNGWNEFTFYCDFTYEKCGDDLTDFIENSEALEIINNYVHPYNSYGNISFSINDFGKVVVTVQKTYTKDKMDIVDDVIDSFIKNNITGDMDDRDKIKSFHDYVINNTKYDSDFTYDKKTYPYFPYTGYGVLVEHKAVCSGYSDAMSIYLDQLGIDNYRVASEEHVWNLVKLDGKWYHLDLTWDDPVTDTGKDLLLYDFFLITSDELKEKEQTQHVYETNYYLETK